MKVSGPTFWTGFILAMLLGACAFSPPQKDPHANLERLKYEWSMRFEENERIRRQRAGLIPDLLDPFGSSRPTDWIQARTSLMRLEEKEKGFVYARIIELLPRAQEPGEKGKAARFELVRIGQIVRLADRFNSPNPDDWTSARMTLQTLGAKGVDAAAVRLILKFRTQNLDVISRAQMELLALGSGAVRHLVLALQPPRVSQYVKERCVDTLVRIGPSALPALLPLLEEGRGRSARYYGARAVGLMGDPGAKTALMEAEAREKDPIVRCAMLESLSLLGGRGAVSAAIRALSSPDLSVVKFGAKALARLGPPEAVWALVDALERTSDDSARDVRDEVLAALRLITGKPGSADPEWWRDRLPR